MGDVRLAGGPLLAAVCLDREVERAPDRLEVRLWVVPGDRGEELLAEDGEVRGLGRGRPPEEGRRAPRTAPRRGGFVRLRARCRHGREV
jgi:hypothetical protein